MKQIVDGYEFDFPTAIDLYKFDETDKLAGNHYHGVTCFKAVDVMAEFPDKYVWIEIKTYSKEEIEEMHRERRLKTEKDKYHHVNWLRNNLIRKYRDTFIYRYCENKLDKPVFYVCLLNFDDALLVNFRKDLRLMLPVGLKRPARWVRPMLDDNHLFVVNEATWNRKLSEKIGTCRTISRV